MMIPHFPTVFEALGIEIISRNPEHFQVGITIDDRHKQHLGYVHGGIYVLLAESAASMAAASLIDVNTHVVFGAEINANHLRPLTQGRVVATAKPIQLGKSLSVYGIELHNEKNQLVSISRCTVAVRERR